MKREIVGQGASVLIVAAIVVAAIIVGGIAWYVTRAPEMGEVVTVTLAFDSGAPDISNPFWVADELGYYKANNLKVEYVSCPMGGATMDAVMSYKADFSTGGAPMAAAYRLGKADLILLATWWRCAETGDQLYAKTDIQEPSDLIGKKMTIIPGTMWEFAVYEYLSANDVSPDEVEYISCTSPVEVIAAAERGAADAVWVWGAGLQRMATMEGWHLLSLLPAYLPNFQFITTNSRVIEEKPEVIPRFLSAIYDATEFCADPLNWPEVAKIIEKRSGVGYTDIYPLLRDHIWRLGCPKGEIEVLEGARDWLLDAGKIKPEDSFEIEDVLNLEYLKQVVPPERITYE